MTAAEMKNEFLIGYDKITNFTAPGYEDSEISKFLNDGQERFFKKNYGDLNKYRASYEETEKRSKDLSELKRFSTISTFTTGNHPNSFFAELPNNIAYVTKEEVEINIIDCHGTISVNRAEVDPVTDDYYTANIKNPFKNPDKDNVWRMDFSRTDDSQVVSSTNAKRHELVTDGSTINSYYLTYLKYPQLIDITNSVSCELDPTTHKEIVEMAVSIALETSQEARYQTQKQEEQFLE